MPNKAKDRQHGYCAGDIAFEAYRVYVGVWAHIHAHIYIYTQTFL